MKLIDHADAQEEMKKVVIIYVVVVSGTCLIPHYIHISKQSMTEKLQMEHKKQVQQLQISVLNRK